MAGTLVRLGWTNPQTGAFGAHPVLGPVLDLNDGVTFTLTTPDGIELPPPPRTLVTTGNIRAQGERVVKAIYRHNREVIVRVIVGPMATYADLASTIRTLVSWLAAPPAMPITLMYQPFNASLPVYLDVEGAAHDIPEDENDWLRLQLEPIELVFVARPGLRGDRVTLSNLVSNPGFELPSGPAVGVFSDTFANTSGYGPLFGGVPSAAGNVMTVPGVSAVVFGSPAWSAINSWQVRFQIPTGGAVINPIFALHLQDNSNFLGVSVSPTVFEIDHKVAGTDHVLASSGTLALTQGAWYWVTLTQFPSVPGDPPAVQAALYNDNAGAIGTVISSLGPVATYDAVTALSGMAGIWNNSNNPLGVGGNYPGVHALSLFGPGGWSFAGTNGSTGQCAGAWETAEGSPTYSPAAGTTYGGGPVTSFGAFRVELAASGTISTFVDNYFGGAPAGTAAMPVAAAGNALAASCWVRSSGVGANGLWELRLYEFDASGDYLRTTDAATYTGNLASWTQLSGTVTTGANCAYVGLLLLFSDSSGGSNGGTLWLDNMQVWNQTTTGQTTMPYCELRFPQSPAQLVVSGLLGDLPAPAFLALGTYLASWPTGGSLGFAVGRRGSVSAGARLIGVSHGWYATSLSPTATPVLDTNSYGGYYVQATVTSGWNPRAFSFAPADAPGVYHILARFLTEQTQANLGNVEVRATMQQRLQAWYGALDSSDQLNIFYAPFAYPMTASNAWTVVDSGQVAVPAFNAGALADPTQTYLTPRTQWADLTSGGSLCQINWQMLLPVDGSLLTGVLNNPANAPFAVASKWLWTYFDGLGTNRDLPVAWAYSLESVAVPNPAHGSGGPGTTGSGAINVNSGADPYLTLDPQLQMSGAGGVNQLAAYMSDGSGAVLPFHGELQYTPVYLYAR